MQRVGRAAFTLIELSIAVFIIGIIVIASLPSFVRSYNNAVLNEAVRSFITTTQLARLQAVMQHQPAVVHIDLDKQMFWVSQLLRTEEGSSEEQTIKSIQLSGRAAIISAQRGEDPHAERQVGVEFYPNGTCQSVTVVFRGVERGNSIATEIDPMTTRATSYPVKL